MAEIFLFCMNNAILVIPDLETTPTAQNHRSKQDGRQIPLFLFFVAQQVFDDSSWTEETGQEKDSGAGMNGRNDTGLGACLFTGKMGLLGHFMGLLQSPKETTCVREFFQHCIQCRDAMKISRKKKKK